MAKSTINAYGIDTAKCVGQRHIPGYEGPYGFQPSFSASVVFCVLFGLSMLGHTGISFYKRTWWQLTFAVGALTEVIGWAGRAWSSDCPYETNPFLIQIICTIIAPAFFTAGIYVILGRLIRTFGNSISPLSANAYLYIFCTADIISLVIQAVGGALAATAFATNPPTSTKAGTNIMVAGIAFQLFSVLVFSYLFGVVIVKTLKTQRESLQQRKMQALVAATSLSVLVVIIRSIYRLVELAEGWTGYVITHEQYFIALDGAMMIIAVGVFNFIQPRWAEQSAFPHREKSSFSSEGMTSQAPADQPDPTF